MTLDAALVAGIIEAQFPQLVPARVTFLGEGYDNTAFDVSGAWVFRFPKRGAWLIYLKSGVADARSPLTPALVHNDLAAEHILVGEAARTVTGIIDWSDMAVGDPAVDFAGMFHWGGEAFGDALLSAYEGSIDDRLVSCARFMAACRGVGDVKFGLETDRPEYIAGGLRALRLCAGA